MQSSPSCRSCHWLPPLAAAFALLAATGCSSFNRDYRQALEGPPQAAPIGGVWRGEWLSDKNGHRGELRGLLTLQEDGRYQARFKARFWKIFTYTSTAYFEMQSHHDGYEFSGTAKLGWLAGGEYFYEGRVNPESFFST